MSQHTPYDTVPEPTPKPTVDERMVKLLRRVVYVAKGYTASARKELNVVGISALLREIDNP